VSLLDEFLHELPVIIGVRNSPSAFDERTNLWNSVRRRSFTNWPLGLSDCPLAWFLKIRSAIPWSLYHLSYGVVNLPSSQRFLTANDPPLELEEPCPKAACKFIKGLAVAISASRMEAFAAFASRSLKDGLNKADN
jgi:hypothetical protein